MRSLNLGWVMRQFLVAANWKMNASFDALQSWLKEVQAQVESKAEKLLFPPFPYLYPAAQMRGESLSLKLGGQNCATELKGAFTGEVSVSMLQDIGADYVLVGHSERRQLYAEDDVQVLQKVQMALSVGLQVIVCVGESAQEREQNQQQAVLQKQLALLLANLRTGDWQHIVIAYEPIWAIGTGVSAGPEQAQAMHNDIRTKLKQVSEAVAENVRIIYGGSVNADNAQSLFAQADVDGALIGGASLQADSFIQICNLAG